MTVFEFPFFIEHNYTVFYIFLYYWTDWLGQFTNMSTGDWLGLSITDWLGLSITDWSGLSITDWLGLSITDWSDQSTNMSTGDRWMYRNFGLPINI